jgi:hypothetical protein
MRYHGLRVARSYVHWSILQRAGQARFIHLHCSFSVRLFVGCSCYRLFTPLDFVLSPSFGFRNEEHNPALKYAPDGRKVGLPKKSVAGGAAAAAASAAAKLSTSQGKSSRGYPPPDIALCRIFRAQDQCNFAQVRGDA